MIHFFNTPKLFAEDTDRMSSISGVSMRLAWLPLLFLCLAAFGDSLPPSVEQLRIGEAHQKTGVYRLDIASGYPAVPSSARLRAQELFGVPINFEWPYVDQQRRSLPQPKIDFEVTMDDTLKSVLDRIVQSDLLELVWIEGSLCILANSNIYDKENLLDTIVNVSATSVSTWDAIKLVVLEVINNKSTDRKFQIALSAFDYIGRVPPDSFAEDRSISIDLQQITAREALFRISAASPLRFSYIYSNYYMPDKYPNSNPTSQILIEVFDQDKIVNVKSEQSTRSVEWWSEQLGSLR